MDVVDGCAPFVLTMTLEYSPDDTESLLGFKPQNGTNYYGLYDFPDIERYLAEDCYVPNEVRDSRTGISCIQVPANTMVAEIVKTVKMAAVIVPDSKIVVFMWYDNDDGDNPDMHVLNMQYFDATDNNIEFAKKYARGTAVRGVDHIDAFDPEKDARQFAQLMSLCNGLVICD